MYVGKWSSGERISLEKVPLDLCMKRELLGPFVVQTFSTKDDGMFEAEYLYSEQRSNGNRVYKLHKVTEMMPPMPPQIRGYSDDIRLPMFDGYGFSASLEAKQRKKEWAAHRKQQP